MIVIRIVAGTLKTLMVLGIIDFIAPGLSYEVTKQVVKTLLDME